ncbi:protein tyrosine phosphatase [Stylonychia lemnae]|uniref:Protein tyrosine phosphatase n=1 Tax=Stylonychia lemnae TaxID=5949 RepID=A0A078A377_STYLE|nr:protein tyrosine phosphatase [Stylonychia lemnae]|eukprot:CDW76622.1 protein tyrosine phosphatase [Stylonychia lemnae]
MVDSTDDTGAGMSRNNRNFGSIQVASFDGLKKKDEEKKETQGGLSLSLAERRRGQGIKVGVLENPLGYQKHQSEIVDHINTEELRIPVADSNKDRDLMSLSVNSPQSAQYGSNLDNDGPVFLEEYNKLYDQFKVLPLVLEGPELDSDYSYFLVDKCEELKELEKAIPLQNYEEESQDRDPEMEFRLLTRMNCHKIHYQNLFKSQNLDFKRKNRYNEVLPFSHSMVKLKEAKDKADRYGYYINASYINTQLNSDKGRKAFIAATAPLPSTTEAFWQMIQENNVDLVIMLCQDQENGKDMSFRYYDKSDEAESESITFDGVEIQIQSKSEKIEGLVKRKILVKRGGQESIVTHLQETKWEDNHAPDHSCEVGVFERINHLINKCKKNRDKNPQGSILVHCSAGCGRTGTLIGLYSILESIRSQIDDRTQGLINSGQNVRESYPDPYYLDSEGKSQERVSIFSAVRRIREQRWNLVKNVEQYKYIYQFTKEWIKNNQQLLKRG